jgi:hypothetical protein
VPHITHRDLVAFAEDRVNLKKSEVDDQRAQVSRLRDRIESKIAASPGYGFVKALHAGSVAKRLLITHATRVAGLSCDFFPPLLGDPGTLADHLPGRRKMRLEHGKDVEGNAHGTPSFALGTAQGAVGGTWWNRRNPSTRELIARTLRAGVRL